MAPVPLPKLGEEADEILRDAVGPMGPPFPFVSERSERILNEVKDPDDREALIEDRNVCCFPAQPFS